MKRRRGSTMVESALVTTAFIFLLVGITEFGRLGFALNSVTYAAHRAARFASTRGSGSGHPASKADIQLNAQDNIVALEPGSLTVDVAWIPTNNNSPGSQVQVVVSYSFKPLLIPISSSAMTLKSTSSQTITQ